MFHEFESRFLVGTGLVIGVMLIPTVVGTLYLIGVLP